MIRLEGQRLIVETATLTAEIEQGFITSLKARSGGTGVGPVGGREWIKPSKPEGSALELVYGSGMVVGFDAPKPGTITSRLLSDHKAEVRFHGWDADGVVFVGECPQTGALLIEPSAYSSRAGVLACRWLLAGIDDELELVAPFFQGARLKLEDELIRDSRWAWPFQWEAGLAILQGKGGGFWIHTQDTHYRYKALKIGTAKQAGVLGLETEAYGPIDASLGAGGLVWRINVHQGDWQSPAREYRKWLWQAYNLQARQNTRRAWLADIGLAIGWCHGDMDMLDELAKKVQPKKVLIHYSQWRTDGYDENYPTYTASDAGRAFIAKAAGLGYHVMPHCNSIDMDPTHPVYPYVRDFQFREPLGKGLQGWAWDIDEHHSMRVPNSNQSLLANRRRKVMIKVHPGLSLWRSILAESIQAGLAPHPTDAVFIDVTLCTWNLHNCLVEDVTSSEGMKLLIDHVAEVQTPAAPGGLVVGGEGLNETIAQGLSIGQVHLFKSSGPSVKGLERAKGCPVNALLFEGLARTFGYSGLSGKNEDEVLRSGIHLSLGAIPTITRPTAKDILQPNPHVKQLLEMAAEYKA